jgi:hypothetical protein
MAKPTYCPRCSRMHDVLLMECPSVNEPISEEALAELEGRAQKLRRTSMVAPGPLAKMACDEVPRLIAEVRRLNLQASIIRNYVNEEGVSDTAKVIRVQGVVNKPQKPTFSVDAGGNLGMPKEVAHCRRCKHPTFVMVDECDICKKAGTR